jgi:hypothetical protein
MAHRPNIILVLYEGDDYKEATNTLMKFQEKKIQRKAFVLSSRYEL